MRDLMKNLGLLLLFFSTLSHGVVITSTATSNTHTYGDNFSFDCEGVSTSPVAIFTVFDNPAPEVGDTHEQICGDGTGIYEAVTAGTWNGATELSFEPYTPRITFSYQTGNCLGNTTPVSTATNPNPNKYDIIIEECDDVRITYEAAAEDWTSPIAGSSQSLDAGVLRFVEARKYDEAGTSLLLDNDGFLDEINASQLATLPAGPHMRWTATTASTLDALEVNGFGSTVTISWETSEGDSGADSVTFGANPQSLNLGGISLPAGGTVDFTLNSISSGQMQLTSAATSIANGWTALQDYSAFAVTSHWATRLIGSEGGGRHTVNVYEDSSGASFYAEAIGEDLTDLTPIPSTWVLISETSTDNDAIEVQLSGGFTLPAPLDGDVHHFSVETLPVSITASEPITGDLDFTRYAVGDQITALPQLVDELQATGSPITATQPDSAPNTVTWDIVSGVVELTRGSSGGLLNSAQGQSGNNGGSVTITDVEWFYDQGNTELPIKPTSLTDTTTPTTTSMSDAFDGAIGDEILGTNSWIRVISTGQVFELDFSSWQSGGGGGFSATATEMFETPVLGWNIRKTVGEFISADANNALVRRSDGLYVEDTSATQITILSSFSGTSAPVETIAIDGVPFLSMADNEATFTSYTSQEIITPRDVTADVYIDFTIKRSLAAQPDSTFSQRSNFTAFHQTFTFNAETGVASVSSGSNPDPVIELAEVGSEFIRYVVRFSEMTGSLSESWRFRPAGDISAAGTGTIYFTEDGFTASTENPVSSAVITEAVEVPLFAKQSGLTGATGYALDSSVIWNDLAAQNIDKVRFDLTLDITGSNDHVLQSYYVPLADIQNANTDQVLVRHEHGAALVDLSISDPTTGAFVVSGFSTIDTYDIAIYGLRAQQTVINTVDTPVNDQTTSSYMDIGTMRIQWGSFTSSSSGPTSVTLPVPFANNSYSLIAQPTNGISQAQVRSYVGSSKSATGFTGGITASTAAAHIGYVNGLNVDWIAIGAKP